MNKCKRLLAGLMTAVLLFSVTACSGDTTWVMKTEDDTLPAGVYIAYLMDAYTEAKDKIDSTKDTWEQTIEDVSVEQWIVNRAVERAKQYIAVNIMYDELGMTLDTEADKVIKNQANIAWEQEQETFEKNGVAFSSVQKLAENNYKAEKLFNHFYEVDGVEAVSEETIQEYFYDNYAKVRLMSFSKVDMNTGETKDLDALNEQIDAYITRINKGENIDTIMDEYVAQTWKDYGLTEEYSPDTSDDSRNITLVNKNDTTSVRAGIIAKTFEQTEYGVPYTDDTSSSFIYLAVRYDLAKDTTGLYEDNRAAVLYQLRGDEFESKLTEYASGVAIELNQESINRYSPKNLK